MLIQFLKCLDVVLLLSALVLTKHPMFHYLKYTILTDAWNKIISYFLDNSIHNYYKSEVEDCVLYYICGYITKNLTKNIKCNVCLTAIAGNKCYSSKPEAQFVNLKSRGGLTYPNNDLIFGLLTAVEKSFVKHCKDNDVFLFSQ